MSNIRTICMLAILTSFTLISPAVAAEDRDRNRNANFFMTLGYTTFKAVDLDVPNLPPDSSINENLTSLKIGGGYRFTPYFGFELYYIYYGEITDDEVIGEDAGVRASALVANSIAIWPINTTWDLWGKVGIGDWYFGRVEDGTEIGSDQGSNLIYSAGVGYNIDYDSTLRFEYEYTEDSGLSFGVISFGFQHNF
jgi:opacity protein-like surface antigen